MSAPTPETATSLMRHLLDRGLLDATAIAALPNPPEGEAWRNHLELVQRGLLSGQELAAQASEILQTPWFDLEEGLDPTVWEIRRDGSRQIVGSFDQWIGPSLLDLPLWGGAECSRIGGFPLLTSTGPRLLVLDPGLANRLGELTPQASGDWSIHAITPALFEELRARLGNTPGSSSATESIEAAADLAATASNLAEAAVDLATTATDSLVDSIQSEDALGSGNSGLGGLGDLAGDGLLGMGGGDLLDDPRQDQEEVISASSSTGGDVEFDPDVDIDLARPLPPGPEAQVLRIVNQVLADAVHMGASDLHLEPFEKDVRVRYRVDGKLQAVKTPPTHLFGQIISRLKILAKMDIAEKRVPQDGGITMRDGDSRVDLRVSTVPTCYGEKMVLRVLAKDAIPDNMEFLGLSEQQAHDFIEAANSHHGLMFVTGPTGSGKSTTLYCALNLTNTPDKNIVTVEDPVEYKFFGLNQVPIRASAGMTFASALRAFLRQDPDVIMVGEVRDTETAQICMRAALTGHLVLSTLHTNSALQVVTRLTDMGIEPFLLGPALRLIEAQRLVRRLCTECKVPYELPDQVAVRHEMEPGETIYGPGEQPDCPKCGGSGYKGRVGIYEVVPVDESLQEMIARGASEKDLREVVTGRGIDLIPDSARKKLREGITSLQEVSDYIKDILAE